MRLSALLSDGMVLQRDRENLIWGCECEPGEEIRVSVVCTDAARAARCDEGVGFADAEAAGCAEVTARADADGRFEVVLPSVAPGGPYTVRVNDFDINDVMCGDVFLLSGQSNMEIPVSRTLDLYEDIVKTMDNPGIRYFEVAKEFRFDGPSDEIYSGKWVRATQDNIYEMSAIGVYFAQMVERDEGVPVGLVQTAVGGAHIEAFMSEERLREVGQRLREKAGEGHCDCGKNDSCKYCYEEQIARNKDAAYVARTIEDEAKAQAEWTRRIDERDKGREERWELRTTLDADGYVECPGMFKALEDVRGVIWLLKTVEIPGHWLDKEVRLYLGTLVDADETYVNGVLVGRTEYRYPPRRYRIPAGVLREGENTIVVRLVANARPGGFVPEMPYYLALGDERIAIDGKWQFKVSAAIDRERESEMEAVTFFNWKPTALYNQMIYPVRRLSFKAALFYQGESNATHASDYEDLMVEMTAGFRELFGQTLPFGFVQLPMFGGEDPAGADDLGSECPPEWLELREAQARAAARIENCVLVDIYDLGFRYELHPQNKMEVAKRLYKAMRELLKY